MTMKQIVVVGAGKIGSTIADMLAETGDYKVTVVDRSQAALDSLETGNPVETLKVEISEPGALDAVLAGKFAVLSAAPFHLTTRIAEAAAKAGVHYLDLTEDVASTRIVKELATTAKSAFIPQCGLAPGFISIVANDLAKRFDTLDERAHARRRAAAVSVQRAQLQSDLEHRRRHQRILRALRGHRRRSLVEVPPLEEREEFSLDGVTYEAFNTSGGLGTLCET
jgi:saccharopine dehydrogenase-like NADP-dependent oxidoreductase